MSKTAAYEGQEWYTDEEINSALQGSIDSNKAVVLAPLSATISDAQGGKNKDSLQETSISNMASLIGNAITDSSNKPLAVALNLGDQHWVSLIIAKNNEGVNSAFYHDSLESKGVPPAVSTALEWIGINKVTNLEIPQQQDSSN